MPFNSNKWAREYYQKKGKKYHREYYLKNKEKFLARSRKQAEKSKADRKKKNEEKLKIYEQESPPFSRPLLVRCFRCQKWFLIKYVPWKKRFSLKNNWDFWTEKTEEENKKICDICLKDLYLNHKKEYRQSIPDLERRMVLRTYLTRQTN